ncbi:MAG: glutamyl-tRNA reductase [Pyrinomonadaceae bacterium]
MEVASSQLLNTPVLFAFGVNHKTASVEVREKLYVHEEEVPQLAEKFKQTLSECLIVSTCNRTEIYGVHPTAEIDFDFYKKLLIEFKNASGAVENDHFFTSVSCNACQQLFSVATSIDSKIIGDTQILQQLRRAYARAKDDKFTGKILNHLLQSAFKIGKKARLETSIHKGAVSVSLAAVELARQTFDSLGDKNILIIGAGETARLTAECLLKRSVGKIFVTNRTRVNAEHFLHDLRAAHDFEGEVVDFENFRSILNSVDVVISSTGAQDFVLYEKDFVFHTNKTLLIDIAVPRDIAPEVGENAQIILKNIDDLNLVVNKNFESRMAELPRIKKIIAREMAEFLLWYYSLPLLPATCRTGSKPDFETIDEIKKIRQFLMSNVSSFHRMARQKSVQGELTEHIALVDRLFAMKENSFREVLG